MRRTWIALIVLLAAFDCSASTAPSDATVSYNLESVDGNRLPYTVSGSTFMSGELVVFGSDSARITDSSVNGMQGTINIGTYRAQRVGPNLVLTPTFSGPQIPDTLSVSGSRAELHMPAQTTSGLVTHVRIYVAK
jgi:hypothetical protein